MDGPYRRFGNYLKEMFGCKVYKIPLDGGFTCPNIDGTLSENGCVYCRNETFRPDYVSRGDPLPTQVQRGKKLFERKNAEKFLGYLQSYTNTYDSVETLDELYSSLLSMEDVVGLCIGTRPDCVDQYTLQRLAGYAREGYEIWLELGLQSSNERTQTVTNRLCGYESYRATMDQLRDMPAINVCSHVMFGLPGESTADMKQTIRDLVVGRLDGIKFHHTQVITGTRLAEWYREGRYTPIDYETYRDLVGWSLKTLPDDVIVHRLYSDTDEAYLLAPDWDRTKAEFENDLRKQLP